MSQPAGGTRPSDSSTGKCLLVYVCKYVDTRFSRQHLRLPVYRGLSHPLSPTGEEVNQPAGDHVTSR